MVDIKHDGIKKTVIINRAVPGSGKTTITNCIIEECQKKNISTAIHSTDEYFMFDDKYLFDIEKLSNYHNSNLEAFTQSIKNKVDLIICDNTNIAPWQSEAYTQLAREHNYQIIIITLNPRELEKHIASQRVTPEKPDAHEVPPQTLKEMIAEYYIYDDLLNPKIVIDTTKHIHYRWDDALQQKIKIGTAKHFDSDFIIRILPDEYKTAQSMIGAKILQFIKPTYER